MSTKESVKLRRRLMPSGNTSLYLDIYRRGVRKLEYLKLYLIPEKNRADKEKNKQTLQLAEAIRSKRHIDLINGEFGFSSPSDGDLLFFPYAEALCRQKDAAPMRSTLYHLRQYEKRDFLTFNDITPMWLEGFLAYLDKAHKYNDEEAKLNANSKRLYFTNLKTILHHAQSKGVMRHDPLKSVENYKAEETTREYLTIEEVRKLVQTDCESEAIRRAFLFACLTGLRRSDVVKLRWGDIQQQGEFLRIVFRQQKTKGLEYLDITPQAQEVLGERRDADSLVFGDILTKQHTNNVLRRWVLRAGIDKKITFHCARHTFAIMMLDIGTDIYTVSKLLGHRELRTTQIYAKVLDKNKQKAVANIPQFFS